MGVDKRSYRKRPFPKHTLEEALEIAQAIQDKNAGKPWKPMFVADAIGRSPGSSEFVSLLSSSLRYGLTKGSYASEKIELTPLGSSVTKPLDPNVRLRELQEAAQRPQIFKSVYEHYRNAKFPSKDKFFENVIEVQFKVPDAWANECIRILEENGRFTGIIQDVAGAPRVVFAEVPPEIPPEPTPEPSLEATPEAVSPKAPEIPPAKQIFLGHGKNRVPLEQLKKILDEFKVPYKVAIEEAHAGRPISKKVADIMQKCSSAIFICTADEEFQDAEGETILRPSDNVVYELGAATVLYGNKIVIFKEEGVTFATDFRDFGYITFEKDKIKAKAMELIKELIAFGFVKVTPT